MPPKTKSAQRSWPIIPLLQQLQPEPGWAIERAVVASYSADLRVVAAAMLALCGAGQDPELANRVRFAQALHRLRGKVAFVVQRGRIHQPHRLNRISTLLDRFLFEADCNEGQGGRSWHPKFVVSQWKNRNKETSWRLWLGSRNLTRDLSRDVGLLLTPGDQPLPSESMAELSRAIQELQRWLPRDAVPFDDRVMQSLLQAKWRLPVGVGRIDLRWIAGEDRFPVVDEDELVDEAIVISPFVDEKTLNRTRHWTKPDVKPAIVAPLTELSRECPSDSSLLKMADLHVMAPSPDDGLPSDQAEPSADNSASDGGQDREVDRSDEAVAIHAKLIYLRHGKKKRLWLGSPNFTHRGWKNNYELAACLTGPLTSDPWGDELRLIVSRMERFPEPPPISTPSESASDRLETLRKKLSATWKLSQKRKGNRVSLQATTPFMPPDSAIKLQVGLPWESGVLQSWPAGHRSVDLGDVPLEACGELILFMLSLGEATTASWLMRAPFTSPLDERRDKAALYAYLGPDGYLSLLNATANAALPIFAPPWDEPRTEMVHSHGPSATPTSGPTLESLLKLYVASAEQFQDFARIVEEYRLEESRCAVPSSPERRAAVERLNDFNRLWDKVGARLASKMRRREA